MTHLLTGEEKSKLLIVNHTLAAIVRDHRPGCQCDLCMATQLTAPQTELHNVCRDPSAAQRILDHIEVNEAMMR